MTLADALRQISALTNPNTPNAQREAIAKVIYKVIYKALQEESRYSVAEESEREDIVNEAFLTLINREREIDLADDKAARAYLRSTLRNKAHDLIYRKPHHKYLELTNQEESNHPEAKDPNTPEQALINARLIEEVEDLWKQLIEACLSGFRQERGRRSFTQSLEEMLALKEDLDSIEAICERSERGAAAVYRAHARTRTCIEDTLDAIDEWWPDHLPLPSDDALIYVTRMVSDLRRRQC